MGEDASALPDTELEEALQELEVEWHDAMATRRKYMLALRKASGSSEYQALKLSLTGDDARIGSINAEAAESIWASQAMELRYLANDDDERYSIQAHPTLLRNLLVQSAEYPIFVSAPTTVWL